MVIHLSSKWIFFSNHTTFFRGGCWRPPYHGTDWTIATWNHHTIIRFKATACRMTLKRLNLTSFRLCVRWTKHTMVKVDHTSVYPTAYLFCKSFLFIPFQPCLVLREGYDSHSWHWLCPKSDIISQRRETWVSVCYNMNNKLCRCII